MLKSWEEGGAWERCYQIATVISIIIFLSLNLGWYQRLIDRRRACNLVPIKIQTEAKISNKLCIILSYDTTCKAADKIVLLLVKFCYPYCDIIELHAWIL